MLPLPNYRISLKKPIKHPQTLNKLYSLKRINQKQTTILSQFQIEKQNHNSQQQKVKAYGKTCKQSLMNQILKENKRNCRVFDAKVKPSQKILFKVDKNRKDQSWKSSQQLKKVATQAKKGFPQIKRGFYFDSCDNFIKSLLLSSNMPRMPSPTNSFLLYLTYPTPHHFTSLQPNQLINHFKSSHILTTKLGLYALLSSPQSLTLTTPQGKNYLEYYPRSYDLNNEFEQFVKDFQFTAVLNLMKKIMIHVEVQDPDMFVKYRAIVMSKAVGLQQLVARMESAMQDIRLLFESSPFNNPNSQHKPPNTIPIHQKLLPLLLHYMLTHLSFCPHPTPPPHLQFLLNYSHLTPPFTNLSLHYQNNPNHITYLTHPAFILFFQIYHFCLQQYNNFLNDGLNNIWIVKTSQGSRGRNIYLIQSLQQAESLKNGTSRIIQKYIENVFIFNPITQNQLYGNNHHQTNNKTTQNLPQLKPQHQPQSQKQCPQNKFKSGHQHPCPQTSKGSQEQTNIQHLSRVLSNKKFDIRFWVLVKSFSPSLEAYIFDQGYLRLSSQPYTLAQKNDLQSALKTHLTNFSINYKSQCNQVESSESYVLFSQFLCLIGNQYSTSLFHKIQHKIHYILQKASQNWRPSQFDKQSFQLFGFDIILDHQLQPWVLECNMSPACKQRGQLKNLVEQMARGMLAKLNIVNFQDHQNTNVQQNSINSLKSLQLCVKRWLPLHNSSQGLTSSPRFSKHNRISLNQTTNLIDFCITGQNKTKKDLFVLDYCLDFMQKVFLIQKFFKHRYQSIAKHTYEEDTRSLKNKKHKSCSKACLMIEKLAQIFSKRQAFWTRKLIKYTKKYLKKKAKNTN